MARRQFELDIIEVERRAFLIETGDVHDAPSLLKEELAAGDVVEPWLAEFPPGLVAVEVLAPAAVRQAGFHRVIRLMGGKMDDKVVHALAESLVAHALDQIGVVDPAAAAGEGLGTDA